MIANVDTSRTPNRCFSAIAGGDTAEFSRLYDRFAIDTFRQCSLWSTTHADSLSAMVEVWLFLWSNASILARDKRSTSEIVRSAASDVIGDRVMRRVEITGASRHPVTSHVS